MTWPAVPPWRCASSLAACKTSSSMSKVVLMHLMLSHHCIRVKSGFQPKLRNPCTARSTGHDGGGRKNEEGRTQKGCPKSPKATSKPHVVTFAAHPPSLSVGWHTRDAWCECGGRKGKRGGLEQARNILGTCLQHAWCYGADSHRISTPRLPQSPRARRGGGASLPAHEQGTSPEKTASSPRPSRPEEEREKPTDPRFRGR
jgi:hypothetical protein